MKIGQYLMKLCVEHLGFTFFWPTLYSTKKLKKLSSDRYVSSVIFSVKFKWIAVVYYCK